MATAGLLTLFVPNVGVDVGMLEQLLHDRVVTLVCGPDQRGPALRRLLVHLDTLHSQQRSHHLNRQGYESQVL